MLSQFLVTFMDIFGDMSEGYVGWSEHRPNSIAALQDLSQARYRLRNLVGVWRDLPSNAELRSKSATHLINAKYPYLAKPTNHKRTNAPRNKNGYFISQISRVSEICQNLFKNRTLKIHWETTLLTLKMDISHNLVSFRTGGIHTG